MSTTGAAKRRPLWTWSEKSIFGGLFCWLGFYSVNQITIEPHWWSTCAFPYNFKPTITKQQCLSFQVSFHGDQVVLMARLRMLYSENQHISHISYRVKMEDSTFSRTRPVVVWWWRVLGWAHPIHPLQSVCVGIHLLICSILWYGVWCWIVTDGSRAA